MKDYSIGELRKINEAYLKVRRNVNSADFVDESFFPNEFDNIAVPGVYEILSEFEANRKEVLGHNTDIRDYLGNLDGYKAQLAKDMVVLQANPQKFRMMWSLIPAQQYQYALNKFVQQGPELFRFPENILRDWLDLVLYNLEKIRIITSICGHGRFGEVESIRDFYFNESVAEEVELGEKLINDWESSYNFLDDRGFGIWEILPDGTDAISDYGIRPITDILYKLPDEPSSADMIVALNRCLDITHQRGDLASAFIEGGSNSLTSISNE